MKKVTEFITFISTYIMNKYGHSKFWTYKMGKLQRDFLYHR